LLCVGTASGEQQRARNRHVHEIRAVSLIDVWPRPAGVMTLYKTCATYHISSLCSACTGTTTRELTAFADIAHGWMSQRMYESDRRHA
jgi:hypothetical protein